MLNNWITHSIYFKNFHKQFNFFSIPLTLKMINRMFWLIYQYIIGLNYMLHSSSLKRNKKFSKCLTASPPRNDQTTLMNLKFQTHNHLTKFWSKPKYSENTPITKNYALCMFIYAQSVSTANPCMLCHVYLVLTPYHPTFVCVCNSSLLVVLTCPQKYNHYTAR